MSPVAHTQENTNNKHLPILGQIILRRERERERKKEKDLAEDRVTRFHSPLFKPAFRILCCQTFANFTYELFTVITISVSFRAKFVVKMYF
jgi:hypothetical protein